MPKITKEFAHPFPLGSTLDNRGCNFSVYAPNAPDIRLALFDDKDHGDYQSYALEQEYAGIRYTFINGIKPGQKYGYLIKLPNDEWVCISDPYAKAIDKPLVYSPPYTAKQSFSLAKCIVTIDDFDWENTTSPGIARDEMVIFETHVKGLTQLHPKINNKLRGKYLGLISDEMLSFYKDNGIRTLQLLPIAACMHEPHLLTSGKANYWGYNPFMFMAPDPRYAINDAVTELKATIRELHRNGIEVILDVVYNHTAEGGEDGPIFNLKGLDPRYYFTHGSHFANFTGCGNTLDLSYQPTLNLVLDTLRYWVTEYHIDGFRFDLAATLGRQGEDFNSRSGFFMSIAQDPILKNVKLIAEPWDIGPNGYQVGNFPFGWNETNDKLRDITRSFWRGDEHYLREFATRIMGSRDIYSASNWPFKLTVNYITYHDGFTMQDLVSYKHKHNERNGEQNRDGHGDNRSENYGIEGPTSDITIINTRNKQKRNFMASLLFAFGIPHILTADLLSHTQNGNNNAYCQDNEISWLNWNLTPENQKFMKWLAKLIKAHHTYMLPFIKAFSGKSRNSNRVFWRKVDGKLMAHEDWNKVRCIALHLGINTDGEELLYLINQTKATARFALPHDRKQKWTLICDTNKADIIRRTAGREMLLPTMSLAILHFDPKNQEKPGKTSKR